MNLLYSILFYAVMAFAVSHAFTSSALPYALQISFTIGFSTAILIFFLSRRKEKERFVYFVIVLSLLLIFLLFQNSFLEKSLCNAFLPFKEIWYAPYSLSYAFTDEFCDISPFFAEFFISTIIVLLYTAASFYSIVRIFSGIVGMAAILLSFYFGLQPPTFDILLITAFWIGILAPIKSRPIVTISALLTGTFLLLFYPSNLYHQPSFLSTIQESILSLTDPQMPLFHGGHAYNTISLGSTAGKKLGSVDGIHFTGRTVADIQSEDTDRRLYLRNTVGSIYHDNHWTNLPDSDYQDIIPLFDNNQGEWYDQSAWLMEVISHSNSLTEDFDVYLPVGHSIKSQKQNFAVSAMYGNVPYYFIPYHASFGSHVFIYDRAPQNENQKIYATYLWQTDIASLQSFLQNTVSSDLYYITYLQGENSYRNFVYNHYLAIPDGMNDVLNRLIPVPSTKTIAEKRAWVEQIRRFFAENYHYETHPGKTPANTDFITYFLTKQKEGYCTYFASAGVMFLRAAGIPARYVTGLTVGENEINEVPSFNGIHNLSINDRHGHAWAEVYVDGIGWEPCELTPGIEGSKNPFVLPSAKQNTSPSPSPSQERRTQPTDSREQPKTNTVSPTKKKDNTIESPNTLSPPNQEKEKDSHHSIRPSATSPPPYTRYFLLWCGICFAVIFIIYFSRRRMNAIPFLLKKAETDPIAFNDMILYVYRLTKWAGCPQKDSYQIWEKSLSQDERFQGFPVWLAIVTENKFSTHPISEQKRKEASLVIQTIRHRCLMSLTRKHRFLFRFIYKL